MSDSNGIRWACPPTGGIGDGRRSIQDTVPKCQRFSNSSGTARFFPAQNTLVPRCRWAEAAGSPSDGGGSRSGQPRRGGSSTVSGWRSRKSTATVICRSVGHLRHGPNCSGRRLSWSGGRWQQAKPFGCWWELRFLQSTPQQLGSAPARRGGATGTAASTKIGVTTARRLPLLLKPTY